MFTDCMLSGGVFVRVSMNSAITSSLSRSGLKFDMFLNIISPKLWKNVRGYTRMEMKKTIRSIGRRVCKEEEFARKYYEERYLIKFTAGLGSGGHQ